VSIHPADQELLTREAAPQRNDARFGDDEPQRHRRVSIDDDAGAIEKPPGEPNGPPAGNPRPIWTMSPAWSSCATFCCWMS
jgi:hypothetical protein